jgi:3'-phosphoadenosine 5'-phosphosulfate sulfotransferase (PAPS reductase)/FAD synthetase
MALTSYKLPDGNVQISFSGGRTSAFMLHQIIEANNGLPDRAKVIFTNTGREMEQTLDFVQECSDRWNVNVIWLEYDIVDGKVTYNQVSHNSASRNGEPFEKLIQYKRILPNVTMRFCTVELKINTPKRYLKNPLESGWKTWTNTVGIRHDEQNRLARPQKKDVFVRWFPLNEAKMTGDDVNKFWSAQSFSLKLPVVKGCKTILGNCDGCFLKSEDQIAMLAKEYPDKFEWWENLEKAHVHRGDYGFFNKSRKLTEFKSFVERQDDWVFDQQGYFCQTDDGECTG